MYSAHTLTIYLGTACLSEVYDNDKKSARNIKSIICITKQRYVSPRDVAYALQIIYANCENS